MECTIKWLLPSLPELSEVLLIGLDWSVRQSQIGGGWCWLRWSCKQNHPSSGRLEQEPACFFPEVHDPERCWTCQALFLQQALSGKVHFSFPELEEPKHWMSFSLYQCSQTHFHRKLWKLRPEGNRIHLESSLRYYSKMKLNECWLKNIYLPGL